jgi:carboxypeptidase PM20D1
MDIVFTALIVLLVLILFVAAFVLLRAVTFARPIEPVEPVEELPLDADVIAGHLSTVLQCKTVSTEAKASVDRKSFLELHQILEKLYPRVHSTLQREVINEFSLLYTWKGSKPELEPILIMAHLDVVPADPNTLSEWEHTPFSGDVADGFIWGRGAIDIKNQVVGSLEAVEGLIKAGYTPERTILLAFGHDEELGGSQGARQISAVLESRGIHLAAVIDEGGAIVQGLLPSVKVPIAMIGVSEKGYLTLELMVEGKPGHSSAPPTHTAIGILARAITRIEARSNPDSLEFVRPMFKAIGSAAPFSTQMAFANTWLLGGVIRKQLLASPSTAATVRTTTAVTMIRGGIKDNVLPSEARAAINFRLLPGDTIAKVCDRLRKVISDDRVVFSPMTDNAWEASPVSPTATPVYRALERTVRQIYGNIPVAPYLVGGATDARYYAPVCDHLYRFSPVLMAPSDMSRMHGINERIAVDSMAQMVRFYTQLIENWSKGQM